SACGTRCEFRESVDFGMGSTGAAVPTLGEDLAGGGEDDGADLRVQATGAEHGEITRTAHGLPFAFRVRHPGPSSDSGGALKMGAMLLRHRSRAASLPD